MMRLRRCETSGAEEEAVGRKRHSQGMEEEEEEERHVIGPRSAVAVG